MPEQTLTDIGLSRNEAKVYLALAELGLATVFQIAEKSKIHRTNVYDSVQKLIDKGLVSESIREGTKQYMITKPENLMNLIKHKEKKIEQLIPTLKLKETLAAKKSEVQLHKGYDAFISLFLGLLDKKQDIFIFGAPPPQNIRGRINEFHKKREADKIKLNVIYNLRDDGRMEFAKKLKYAETTHFKKDIKSSETTIICGNTVLLAIWLNPALTIKIEDKEIATGYHEYFKVLWDGAEKNAVVPSKKIN